MTDRAVIAGSLVDVRNFATDKCVRLTIHVSAELALKVFEAFGWPTGVDPVPVAIARIQQRKEVMPPVLTEHSPVDTPRPAETLDKPRPGGRKADAEKRRFTELIASQQSGILCGEPAFWKFLGDGYQYFKVHDAETAAQAVRDICKVKSRSELNDATSQAGHTWDGIVDDYRAWQHEPEFR